MHHFHHVLFSLILLTGSGLAAETVRLPTDTEIRVIQEMNIARQNPKLYASYLRSFRKTIRDGMIHRGNVRIRTQEGTKAVDEAIRFLEKQRPVGALRASRGLTLAARDHAEDQSKSGETGHKGQDGSFVADRATRYGKWLKTIGENIAYGFQDPRDVIIQLIVDDGVKDRGHRTNIFNPNYRIAGVACAPHPKFRHICVLTYGGGFENK